MGLESSRNVEDSITRSGGMVSVTAAVGADLSFEMVWNSCLDVAAGYIAFSKIKYSSIGTGR